MATRYEEMQVAVKAMIATCKNLPDPPEYDGVGVPQVVDAVARLAPVQPAPEPPTKPAPEPTPEPEDYYPDVRRVWYLRKGTWQNGEPSILTSGVTSDKDLGYFEPKEK